MGGGREKRLETVGARAWMTGCALCFVPSKKLKLPLCLPHCSRNQAVDPGGNSFHDSFQSKDPLVTWDYSAGQSCSPPFIFSSDSQSHLIIHLPGLERILPRPGNPLTRPQTAVEHQQVNGSDVSGPPTVLQSAASPLISLPPVFGEIPQSLDARREGGSRRFASITMKKS